MTSPRHPLPLLHWLTTKAKGGRAGRGPRCRGVPRTPPAHPSHPCVPRRAPLFKPPPRPRRAPNPSCLGELLPCPHTDPAGRKGEQGGRRMRGAVHGRSRLPRRPKPPVVGAGPAVAENAYFLCFPYFLDVALPPSSSSLPMSRTTTLHRRLHYGPWPTR
jgi:hypothetical protein